MTVVYAEGVRSRGNESLIFVTTLANPAAPKLTELNAVTAVNLSGYVSGFEPQGSQDSVDDVRLLSEQTFEDPGDVAISINPLEYVYDPQATTAAPGNAAADLMVNGATGYLVDRRGLNARTAPLAVGQKVDVYPVRLGEQFPMPLDPSAQGGKFRISQKPFVTGLVERGVALVA